MIRLVIVDDMPDIRNYLAEELAAASEQFSVVGAAEDGTEAVKLVDSLLPDVVLMDIQMKTRTEGIYAIRIIHERHPDIKCIALSIHEDDELIFQAYLAGAADYIIKTRSIDTIKNSILAVVNNRLLLRPEVGQRLIQEYQRVQNQENRMKETMDALVIAPELAKSCGLIEHKAVVGPPNARKLAVTYGFKRWPALVFFRDGKYLGAVDGLRLWADLVREADEIMHSEPHYPPSVGIPVRSI